LGCEVWETGGMAGGRTLHAPVMDEADLIWEREGDEIGYAKDAEDDGEEAEGGGLCLEGAGMGLEDGVVSDAQGER